MKTTITYKDFTKLDLRVGLVVGASVPTWSKKLLELKVDFGEEIGMRIIMAGLKAWYSPDDFIGKKFPFIANLSERKMGEGVSQGMMLVANEDEKPILLSLAGNIQQGCEIC